MHKMSTIVLILLGWLIVAACSSGQSAPSAASVSHGIGADSVDLVALAYEPNDDSLLKADSMGLWRWRVDRGWQVLPVPEAAAGFSGVVANPDQPGLIYASGQDLGVIESDDGGKSWQAINTGLPNLDVTALALHSFRRATLYAWVHNEGIYRTEDGGATWEKVPDEGPSNTDVRRLVHSTLPGSMNTGWLYAATPSGAYLSMDCF
ncbi:hypothetical protein KC957_04045 [Candidatus Saccharibacteria bacterium]|nr:hypothetical protein [Candidatus Saccharibacteria bacterium]